MSVEVVDGGLVLSALLVIVILSLLTYIFSHHPKHLTNNNMPLQVVNQDKLDLNLPENPSTGSTSTSETLTSLVEADQSEAVGGEAQDNHVAHKLDPNLLEKRKIISEEKETTNQYANLLKNLEYRMLAINHLIDDAEDKETTNLAPRLKQWLDDLREVVYDAEDVRDVIATQTHENHKVSTTTPWNPFDRSLQEELEDVLYRMQCLIEQKDVFGLKPSALSNSTSQTLRLPTTSLVEQYGVYGRDDDKEEIKKLLLSNDGSNGDVIAIVGMGGLGKTTLAQLIFNDYQIEAVFKPNKVWICVAQDFNVEKMTKTILEKLTKQSCHTKDFDQVQIELKEFITGKKFLIVLDDVWNENFTNWENLRRPFGFAAPGSKIILTTRSERVVDEMRATSLYKLKPLPDEACWKLFSEHAFENIQPSANSSFEANVVKKCGGLPLVAKVLGGILRKRGREEWGEILRSNIWDLPNDVLPVLRLSYHYLPSNLKRCFVFCSIVPKDFHYFEREKLVLLWMTENFLQDSKGKRRIDVGYEYLRDLESRSLIQRSTEGELYFSMHALVNDLAKSVSGEFYKSFDLGKSFNVGVKTRHFSYAVTSDNYDPVIFEGVNEAKRLRTYLPLVSRWTQHSPSMEIWLQLNVLRSLTLARAGIEKLHDSIGNLKLLRYLDLSENRNLKQLPESVASLYNLEVLILAYCTSLTKLPSKMRQLAKLNHLDVKHTKLQEMPMQMGKLKDLDVLTTFVVGKGSDSSITDLKDLKYLRGELSIRDLQNINHPENALEANLEEKSRLEQLFLTWEDIDSGNSENATKILENLRPHVNLIMLHICRYSGTRLPDWSGHYSFVNLLGIHLCRFKHCMDLSPLGQLPSLESLGIFECDSQVTLILPNEIHHHVGHFSALVNLKIWNCPKLELPEHHRFTSIEDFTLCGSCCASLKFFPLSLFPKLKKLRLEDLQSIESLLVIDETDNFNLKYLESIKIRDCPNLEYLDAGQWCAPKMTYLCLNNCGSLKVLTKHMSNIFPSLLELHVHYCRNLTNLDSKCFQLLTSLETLQLRTLIIDGCKKLMANRSRWGLQRMLSLSTLKIRDFDCDGLESFPEEGLLPSSLSELWIEHVPNLTNLNSRSFQLLTSIQTLKLHNCHNLRCLPELPTSVSLIIEKCPLLESPCQREQGEDLAKIAHIPNIQTHFDFVVGKGSAPSIGELRELQDLRHELRIHGLQNITHPGDALEANLEEKSHLEQLSLSWDDIDSDNSEDARRILENLRPHVNLKRLSICRYSGTRLPDWSGHYSFNNLLNIHLCGFKHCLDLSPLGQLPSLKFLDIKKCESLVTLIPVEIHHVGHFSGLVYLSISDCPKLVTLVGIEIPAELPNEIHPHVRHFSTLVELKIWDCPKLELPQHHRFTSIENFILHDSCASLRFFPLSLFPKLKKLSLQDLQSIESLAVIDEANNLNLEYLESILIKHCPNLEDLDAGKWCAPKMTVLCMHNCESLKVLPEHMCNIFPSLLELHLYQCRNLTNINGKCFQLLTSSETLQLRTLTIFGCKKLIANRSKWGLQRMLSLSSFSISDFECDDSESFPEEGLLPSSLSTLMIDSVPNLRSLNGNSIQLLTSLETLQLRNCPKLQYLSELPASLFTLYISKCPLLESRCQREQGEDWSKIAHIPNIQFY